MPKKVEGWKKGEGPYSKSGTPDDKLRKDDSALGYHAPKDISNRVDPSWKRTDGFSAKLDKGPKEDA
jgi:hypothetical protein